MGWAGVSTWVVVLVLAAFGGVGGEVAVGGGHEFAAVGEELDELCGSEVVGGAGVEAFVGAELVDYGVGEVLCGGVGVALHHVEYFVSVCHGLDVGLKG